MAENIVNRSTKCKTHHIRVNVRFTSYSVFLTSSKRKSHENLRHQQAAVASSSCGSNVDESCVREKFELNASLGAKIQQIQARGHMKKDEEQRKTCIGTLTITAQAAMEREA